MRIEAHETHVSEFAGTPSHMAPEAQLQGRLSKAADVYSFGVFLWEAYTGGHAFGGEAAEEEGRVQSARRR